GPDLRATIRPPLVIPLGDDGDESTIVRRPFRPTTDSNTGASVEEAQSQSNASSSELRINCDSPQGYTETGPYYDQPLPHRSIPQTARQSTGWRVAGGLAALLILSILVFVLAKRFAQPWLEKERTTGGPGDNSTTSMQPIDAASIREAVLNTLNG